jgi:hypothetical protein
MGGGFGMGQIPDTTMVVFPDAAGGYPKNTQSRDALMASIPHSAM